MAGKSKDKLIQELAKQLKVLQRKGACSNYPTLDQFQKHGGIVLLTREIKADGKVGYLSDDAFEALGEAANIVWKIIIKDEISLKATEEEIYKECKKFVGWQLLKSCGLKGVLLIEHVCEALRPNVDSYLFATPLHGIVIEDLTRWDVGNYFISKPDKAILDACSVRPSNIENIELAWEKMQYGIWICGTATGTPDYAEQEFFTGAKKIISALAITFSLTHDGGAASSSLSIKAEQAHRWFGYGEENKTLRVSWKVDGRTHLRCNQEQITSLRDDTEWFFPLVRMLTNDNPTELQSAVQRAGHWFNDAQSDPEPDMRFLKFWSCIECFFSTSPGETTKQIRNGLSAMLIYGGWRLASPDEWRNLRKTIDRLYDLRSKAVHDARHGNVRYSDVVTVSKWAAAVILGVGALDLMGYTTRKQLEQQIIRLTGIHQRS